MCDCPIPSRKITEELLIICSKCSFAHTRNASAEETAVYRWLLNTYLMIIKDNQKRSKAFEKVQQHIMKLHRHILSTVSAYTGMDPVDRQQAATLMELAIPPTGDMAEYCELVKKASELTKAYIPTIPPKTQSIICPKQHTSGIGPVPSHQDGKVTVNCPSCSTCHTILVDVYTDFTSELTDIEEIAGKYTYSGQPYSQQLKNSQQICMWIYLGQRMSFSESDLLHFGNIWLGLDIATKAVTSPYFE